MNSAETTIRSVLAAVRRRLGLNRLVAALGLGFASALAVLVTAVVLDAILAPTSIAGIVLKSGIVLAVVIVAFAAWRGSRPVPESVATLEADARADLKDTLKSALALAPEADRSPWVAAFMQRAADAASKLDANRVIPLVIPSTAWVALGFAMALVAAIVLAPRITPTFHDAATPAPSPVAKSPAAVAEVKSLLDDVARTGDGKARAKLEKVLAALERPDASADEKRRALAEAKSALDQQRLETSSNVESLQQLAASLAGREQFAAVAQALKEGDAARAADEMRKLAATPGAARPQAGEGGDTEAGSKPPANPPEGADLEAALQSAAQAQPDERGGETQGKMQQAVRGLEELAKKLDVQSRLNQAQRKLNAMSMAMNQQDRGLRAARFGQQEGQQNNPGAGSSETGNADIEGGHMFRLGAVAREAEPPPGQEGRRTGDATGNAPGDPVVGDEVRKIQAKLEKKGVRGREAEGPDGADSTFYAASRMGDAKVGTVAVQSVARPAAENALSPERIALRHRAQVKGFFTDRTETR